MAQENKNRIVAVGNLICPDDADPFFAGQRGFLQDSPVRDSAGVYRIFLDPRFAQANPGVPTSVVQGTYFSAAARPALFCEVGQLDNDGEEIVIRFFDTAGVPAEPDGLVTVMVIALAQE